MSSPSSTSYHLPRPDFKHSACLPFTSFRLSPVPRCGSAVEHLPPPSSWSGSGRLACLSSPSVAAPSLPARRIASHYHLPRFDSKRSACHVAPFASHLRRSLQSSTAIGPLNPLVVGWIWALGLPITCRHRFAVPSLPARRVASHYHLPRSDSKRSACLVAPFASHQRRSGGAALPYNPSIPSAWDGSWDESGRLAWLSFVVIDSRLRARQLAE